MKSNQKGFSVVETLIVVAVVGLIGGAGWYVWQSKTDKEDQNTYSSTNNEAPTPNVYERTTTVPSDWKTFSNEQYKISMSYPKDWVVRSEDNDGELSGWIYPDKSVNPQGNLQFGFSTNGQSLDEVIAERKRIVNNNQSAEDGIKLTITNEKTYTIDGHKAIRIDMTADDGTDPDSYATEFYVFANNRVYIFDTSLNNEDAMKDKNVLTLFESIKIQ